MGDVWLDEADAAAALTKRLGADYRPEEIQKANTAQHLDRIVIETVCQDLACHNQPSQTATGQAGRRWGNNRSFKIIVNYRTQGVITLSQPDARTTEEFRSGKRKWNEYRITGMIIYETSNDHIECRLTIHPTHCSNLVTLARPCRNMPMRSSPPMTHCWKAGFLGSGKLLGGACLGLPNWSNRLLAGD